MGKSIIYAVGRAIADLYAEEANVALPQVKSFQKYLGGSSANTAVGLARLGNAVGLIARVGRDPMGQFILSKLQDENVDVRMTRQDSAIDTGIAFAALFPPNDSNVWFCGVPNANSQLSVSDIDRDAIKEASALVLAGTVFAQDPSRSAGRALLEIAHQSHIPVILDVDFRPMFWPRNDVAEVYDQVLREVTVVLANEMELELVGRSEHVPEASHRLLDLGVSEVVAKRGVWGSWYFSSQQVFHCPAFAVPVVNTLGAGDGFAAGYVHGFVSGSPPEERMRLASACGAIVVSRHSCSEAMPTAQEVESFLEHCPDEVKADG